MQLIDVLLFDQINLLDIAGPAQAFNTAELYGDKLYRTRFVSLDGKPVTSCSGLTLAADGPVSINSSATNLIVPGGEGVDPLINNAHLRTVLNAWRDNTHRRLISICSGALLLAGAGVLDNRSATTHWSRSTQARRQFPNVNWQTDKLYVGDGNIYTSAGVTTGIDLSLSLIQADHNSEVALHVARELVVYMQRPGGQSQFSGIVDLQLKPGDTLGGLVDAIIQHPARLWKVDTMAEFCNLTERTLSRHFHKHLNTSPKRFVEKIRVEKACELLSSGMPIPLVLAHSGINDHQQLKRAFQRQLNTSVNDYIKRFSTADAS